MSLCYERENGSLGILYQPIRALCSDKIIPADNLDGNKFLSIRKSTGFEGMRVPAASIE